MVGCEFRRRFERIPQRLIDRQPAIHRIPTGLGKHPLQQLDLLVAQRLLERRAVGRQFKQTFTLVGVRSNAQHHFQFGQLPQRRIQSLLADAEQRQQLFNAQARITRDEKHDALVHPAQATAVEHFISFRGKRLIAEKEGFHGNLLGG